MKKGYLSEYFDGVAAKVLSQVETDLQVSHQHEFNGVKGLRTILGSPSEKEIYKSQFMYFTDFDDEPLVEEGELSWYDSRKGQPHRSAEYRLYFTVNTVMQMANVGDIVIIAKTKKEKELLVIIAEKETTIASQLLWLFGFSSLEHPGFSIREELETEQDRIEFASRIILENIGIEVEITKDTYLDDMLRTFGGNFPGTREFSEYTRKTLTDIDFHSDFDNVLMACYEREEILFRTLEKHIVAEKLKKGFGENVDEFMAFSLSVQNRRKSRVGLALENQLEYIFTKNEIYFDRTPVTENKSKPDFLFPGIREYRDLGFNTINLTMLGVKSTCKDRWRQVLTEAKKIEKKHLFTLESAISTNQTDEMKEWKLQLVVPKKLHNTYREEQQKWLFTLDDFMKLVKERQII